MTNAEKAAIEEQVAQEKKELADLPKVPLADLMPKSGGLAGRCSFCGRFRTDLSPFDVFHGVERYRGGCCGGHTHGVAQQVRPNGG